MPYLLSFLALAALVIAVVGLFKPDLALFFLAPEKSTRLQAFGLYAIIFIVCVFLLPVTEKQDESDAYLAQLKAEAEVAEPVKAVKASAEQIAVDREAVRKLYDQLVGFKGDTVFHQRGFGAGNPHAHKWLQDVEAVGARMDFKRGYPLALAASAGYLEQLGLEYMKNQGAENQLTRDFRKFVEEGLAQ